MWRSYLVVVGHVPIVPKVVPHEPSTMHGLGRRKVL